MMKILLAFALILFQDTPVSITSPESGQVLRGKVIITGNINATNFASAEISFAYASDSTSTWFAVQTFSQPTTESNLVTWDTTTLTDGDYTLRLRVYLLDGSIQEVLVKDLKIRNDVPLPTDTPTLQSDSVLAAPLPTATSLPATVAPVFPSPTPLPVNPASLTTLSIYSTFGRGVLLAFILFFIISLFLRLRRS